MRKIVLAAVLVLSSSLLLTNSALGASYQLIDGTIAPVGNLLCCGYPVQAPPFVGPGLILPRGSHMGYTSMPGVDLRGSSLEQVSLNSTNFSGGDFRGSYMLGVNLRESNLDGTDLRGVNLSFARNLATIFGTPLYDSSTNFGEGTTAAYTYGPFPGEPCNQLPAYQCAPFDPVAAGWNLVPEPSTAVLLGLGLTGLAGKGRRRNRS